MDSHKVDYTIDGTDVQVVSVELDPNETVIAEAGAMCWMNEGINFEAKLGDGAEPDKGFFGRLKDAGKRMLSGESLFLTHFTNIGTGKKSVSFAAPYPGTILPIDLNDFGGAILCQGSAFLCAAMGTKVSFKFNKKLGSGFFGGEGFVLQELTGNGMAFLHAGGTIVKKELKNETLLIDTGCVVAFSTGLNYDIQKSGSIKTMMFGSEGMFLATISGTGTVYVQSLPFSKMVAEIHSRLPKPSVNHHSD
ncbi:MAG: TIGR00266 family protein [Cyclobacteriaceae bacterium]